MRVLLTALALALCAATSSAQSPAATFRDCPHCPEMIRAAPGSFLMGSPPSGGAKGEPNITFYTKMDTPDIF